MSGKRTTTKATTEAGGEWYSGGLHFACTQCGNCCTGAPGIVDFTPAELEAMARHLGLLPDEFLKRHARRRKGWWCLREVGVNGQQDCVFLVREPETGRGLCAVYEVRPVQCRTWPFWPENLESPETWEETARGCPGMADGNAGARRVYPVEEIRRLSASAEGDYLGPTGASRRPLPRPHPEGGAEGRDSPDE